MEHVNRLMRGACVCALAGLALSAAAQTAPRSSQDANVDPVAARQQAREIARGDPVRWYREDPDEQTRRKEIGAALQEARNACRQRPAAERKACTAEAQAIHAREMAQLRPQAQPGR